MSDLPHGTVTFLFTDIEGSTQLIKALGDRYETVLVEHDRCMRAAFAAAGGREVDTQGDAFFAAFPRATDAVAAAVDVQRRLAKSAWPDDTEVRVRIGLHTAEPKVGSERYIGLGVHKASRICAAAHGGQILLSSVTGELVEDTLPPGFELLDLGRHTLKDIDRPETLFQLVGPELADDFPPVRSASAQPDAAAPFAGREEELGSAAHASLVERRAFRRKALALAIVAALTAAAVALAFLRRGDDPAPASASVSLAANSVGVIDATTGRVTASIGVGDAPGPVAVDSSDVWVGNVDDATLSLIDARTRKLVRTYGLPLTPTAVEAGDGAVWIAYNGCTPACVERTGASHQRPEDTARVEIARFDAGRARVVWRTKLSEGGPGRVSIALADGAVWVGNEISWEVTRLNEESGAVEETVTTAIDGPKGLASDASAVWVLSYPNSWVSRIDSGSSQVIANVPIDHPWAIGGGPAGIWVTSRFGEVLWRIDTGRNQTARSIEIPGLSSAIAVGQRHVWVAHGASGKVTRVDPEEGTARSFAVGRPLADIAVGDGSVWVTAR